MHLSELNSYLNTLNPKGMIDQLKGSQKKLPITSKSQLSQRSESSLSLIINNEDYKGTTEDAEFQQNMWVQISRKAVPKLKDSMLKGNLRLNQC